MFKGFTIIPWFPVWWFFDCVVMSLEVFDFDVYRLDPSSDNNLCDQG
jgi:hypothetical protein